MLTDRAPFEYRYLSRRLLTDLVQHDEAARSRWSGSFDLPLRMLSLHLHRKAPEFTNLHDLAMRSPDLVSDNTGTLSEPGLYVRGQAELHHGVFSPHMGWLGGHIACYRGEAATPDGSVFIALFGSASNIVGWRRRDEDDVGSYYPSDVTGLYALLDAAREPDDPEIDFDFRWDDHAMSDEDRARRAVMFAREGATSPAQALEFLARVFLVVDDDSFASEEYRRVIVGAPLWVATPRPQPFQGV